MVDKLENRIVRIESSLDDIIGFKCVRKESKVEVSVTCTSVVT